MKYIFAAGHKKLSDDSFTSLYGFANTTHGARAVSVIPFYADSTDIL